MSGFHSVHIEQERLQKALEAADIGVWDFNPITNEINWSRKCYELFGLTPGQPVNLDTFLYGLHSEDKERAVQMINDALNSVNKGYLDMEYRIVHAQNGSIYWVRATGKAYFGEDGTANRLIGIIEDISPVKNSQAKAKEKERLIADISDSAPVAIWVTDEKGDCIFKNQTWSDWTGLTHEETMGTGWLNAVNDQDRSLIENSVETAIDTQRHFYIDFRIIHKNGYVRWCQANGMPRYSEKGEFIGLVGSCVDITERKEWEKAMKFKSALLEAEQEASPDGILITDGKGKIIMSNSRFAELWNTPKEIIHNKDDEAALILGMNQTINPEDAINKVQEVYKNPNTIVEDELYFTNGMILERRARPIIGNDGTYYGWAWYFKDITEQRRAEQELQRKNSELQLLMQEFQFVTDFMPQIVWVTEPDGYHDFFNRKWYEYTGLSLEQSKGEGWSLVLHPDDFERAKKIWRHSLETGESYEIEYRFRRKDGKYRWFLGRALPMKNEEGKILKWFGTCTDVHDQKIQTDLLEQKVNDRTQELQAANNNLERSNRELEQFAYIASHDLQEPLRKIRTFIDMMNMDLQNGEIERVKQQIFKINQSSARMNDLIKDLLNFSRLNISQSDTFEKTDLNTILRYIQEDLELAIMQKSAHIISDDLPIINAIPLQMSQLFYNLLNNSLKFSKKDTPVKIEIRCKMLPPDEKRKMNHLDQQRNYYDILFKDNGIGFSQEYAEQIFTIFQRLHARSAYEGTGIGLALCKKIALNHQGDIYAVSKEGEGAEFHVILPE